MLYHKYGLWFSCLSQAYIAPSSVSYMDLILVSMNYGIYDPRERVLVYFSFLLA